MSRLVRGVVLSLREQPYVDAAVASGTRTPVSTDEYSSGFWHWISKPQCRTQRIDIGGTLDRVVCRQIHASADPFVATKSRLVPELLRVLDVHAGPVPIRRARPCSEHEAVYDTPAREFTLSRVDLAAGARWSTRRGSCGA